ncbi:MAG: pilus assembly protein PilM, partial [bacterium]
MASANACWGIEVGASSVKALKLEATGDGKVKVVDYAIVQHAKPLSTPGVDANDVIRVSLGQLASQLDLSKASVAVSVPGHAAFARFAKLPPVEPKKVPDIVKFEAMQQIPFPLEEVEWDYQTFVTPDSPEIEVGIFAIHRDRVMERLAMLQDVGITPSHIVLSPIAVYNALAYDLDFDTNTPGTIIVDVGTTSTDLVVATPGRV